MSGELTFRAFMFRAFDKRRVTKQIALVASARFEKVETENVKLRADLQRLTALSRVLIEKMQEVYKDPQYFGVFQQAAIQGIPYTGKQWAAEFYALKVFLDDENGRGGADAPTNEAGEP